MNKKNIQQYMLKYLKRKIDFKIISYSLFEGPEGASIVLNIEECGEEKTLEGTGVGLVDATFNAFLAGYLNQYKSLATISLSDAYFVIDYAKRNSDSNVKSRMKINLEFENHSRAKTSFEEKTTSLSYTAVKAVMNAMQFYINCELLFARLKFLIEDAKKRSRPDMESAYCYALSSVVEVTNYRALKDV